MARGDGRLPSRLLFVADSSQAPEGLPLLVSRAVAAGLDFFELRRKTPLGTAARVDEARACVAAAPGATVLVNDRVDVALLSGAQGAHVGQDDLGVVEARRLLGQERWLGLSTHDEEQFARGQVLPLDYLALGPIFGSRTKSGHAAVVGLERLRRCCASSELPVIAIGGMTPERARLALEAGARAVAVASGLALGEFEANASAFRQACGLGRESPWLLTGLPGVGKTSVGRELARLSGRRFVDLDQRVEAATGRTVSELFAERGEAAFREEERRALEELLEEKGSAAVIALGGGTLGQPACRSALDRASGRVAWLELSPAACAGRLGPAAGERPLLRGLVAGDLEVSLARLLEERRAAYERAELRLDASGSPDRVARRLLEAFRALGASVREA